jgi:hypothetical protein
MDHEQLLHGVTELERLAEGMWTTKALRAVVELHKPMKARFLVGDLYDACSVCTEGTNDGDYHVDYPCLTIKTIIDAFK